MTRARDRAAKLRAHELLKRVMVDEEVDFHVSANHGTINESTDMSIVESGTTASSHSTQPIDLHAYMVATGK